jgi:hypothetical protein
MATTHNELTWMRGGRKLCTALVRFLLVCHFQLIVQLKNFERSSSIMAPSIFDGFLMEMDRLEGFSSYFL